GRGQSSDKMIEAGARADRPEAIHALFDLRAPASAPFPSDWFTVSDLNQNTGRQVALPYPDCDERPSDCEDIAVINTLDGFNLQPRPSIPFDGPIDLQSATSQSVFLISLGSTLDDAHEPPGIVGIFGMCVRIMRKILVDHARAQHYQKRGGAQRL